MSVYVITGTSKGIGFGMLKNISEDSKNLVIGLVRDKAGTEKKVAAELGNRPNVHILHGDLASHASLKQAAADTTEIVGERGVDYLIANAGNVSQWDAYDPISTSCEKPDELDKISAEVFATNVIGNMHFIHSFMPLVLKGKVKKVIAISSGHSDLDLINRLEFETSTMYAASKAALNVIVAKFQVQYKKDGVLCFSISPGIIDVGHFAQATPEQLKSSMGNMAALRAYAPYFKGPYTVDEGVRNVRELWERASLGSGYSGAFVSHFGNKQWI